MQTNKKQYKSSHSSKRMHRRTTDAGKHLSGPRTVCATRVKPRASGQRTETNTLVQANRRQTGRQAGNGRQAGFIQSTLNPVGAAAPRCSTGLCSSSPLLLPFFPQDVTLGLFLSVPKHPHRLFPPPPSCSSATTATAPQRLAAEASRATEGAKEASR